MSNLKGAAKPVVLLNDTGNLALVVLEILQKAGCPVDPLSFHDAAQRRYVAVSKGRVCWSAREAMEKMEKAGFRLETVEGLLRVGPLPERVNDRIQP